MREILFRGKRTDNGEWVCGWYAPLVCNDKTVIPYIRNENGTDKEVVPETVGQYTGLTDKNGKKIFEEDILDCGDRVVIVEWHRYCGTWDSRFIKYKGEKCSNGIIPFEWKYRAVIIGNIHDNPELLEGGEK